MRLANERLPPDARPVARGRDLSLIEALAVISAVIVALYVGRDVFIPLALAMLLGVAMMPVVGWLERRGLPRVVAVILVVLLSITMIAVLALLLASQVLVLAEQLPQYEVTLREKLKAVAAGGGVLQRAAATLQNLSDEVAPRSANEPALTVIAAPTDSPFTGFLAVIAAAAPFVATIAIALLLMAFLLMGRESVRDRFLRLTGTRDLHRTTRALADATERIGRYLLMHLVVNGTFGLAMGVGLAGIGIANAPLWGLLGFLLRFVPFLGAPLSVLFPLFVAFATTDGWTAPILVLILFIFVDVVITYVMEPWLYGGTTGISPLALLISAALWSVIWGPVGLILAPPLTACLVIIGRYVPSFNFLEVIFGSGDVLEAETRFYQRLLAADVPGAEAIAEAHLDEHGMKPVLEEIAVPTLVALQQDRREGQIGGAEAAGIANDIAELLFVLADPSEPPGEGERVVVFGLGGALDRAAAMVAMLTLREAGYAAHPGEPHSAADAPVSVIAIMEPPSSVRLRRALAMARQHGRPVVLLLSDAQLGAGASSLLEEVELVRSVGVLAASVAKQAAPKRAAA